MDDKDLAQSACRIFGHQWDRTRYRAYTDPDSGKLVIRKTRSCKRCGEIQSVETSR